VPCSALQLVVYRWSCKLLQWIVVHLKLPIVSVLFTHAANCFSTVYSRCKVFGCCWRGVGKCLSAVYSRCQVFQFCLLTLQSISVLSTHAAKCFSAVYSRCQFLQCCLLTLQSISVLFTHAAKYFNAVYSRCQVFQCCSFDVANCLDAVDVTLLIWRCQQFQWCFNATNCFSIVLEEHYTVLRHEWHVFPTTHWRPILYGLAVFGFHIPGSQLFWVSNIPS
jgi:hypothetical protein